MCKMCEREECKRNRQREEMEDLEAQEDKTNKRFMDNKKALFSSVKDNWSTPVDFFEELNREFSFTLDPCSDDKNYKCQKHYTKNENGLEKDWGGRQCFAIPRTAEKYTNG